MEHRYPRLLDLDPNRDGTAATPRDASTVVVIRALDAAEGLEVFCVRRHAASAFMGGALVFPGGKVDEADGAPDWEAIVGPVAARVTEMTQPAGPSARGLCVAACRETLEEGTLLPALREGGEPISAADVEALRRALVSNGKTEPRAFAAALRERRYTLALDALHPWARWVTPVAEARRFDARFFLLELPEGQVGRHDEHETTHSFWGTPRAVLDQFARGEVWLAPPTTRTLEVLLEARTVAAAKVLAAAQSLAPICPAFVPGEGDDPPALALPGDPAHPVEERRVAGPTRFVLRDGKFVSEEPRGARGVLTTGQGGGP